MPPEQIMELKDITGKTISATAETSNGMVITFTDKSFIYIRGANYDDRDVEYDAELDFFKYEPFTVPLSVAAGLVTQEEYDRARDRLEAANKHRQESDEKELYQKLKAKFEGKKD